MVLPKAAWRMATLGNATFGGRERHRVMQEDTGEEKQMTIKMRSEQGHHMHLGTQPKIYFFRSLKSTATTPQPDPVVCV